MMGKKLEIVLSADDMQDLSDFLISHEVCIFHDLDDYGELRKLFKAVVGRDPCGIDIPKDPVW